MSNPAWTSGYVSDVAYTLGFYREMSPPMLNYALALGGIAGPAGPLRYCELGCGRGYGTALLAAANPGSSFVGIDFNPGHIREAQELADRAALGNMKFVEASFGEASQSADPALAAFDVVTLHGVFSWVSPQVRAEIVAFLRNKLAPGGVVYVSYNTYPGWATTGPVQYLLKAMADRGNGNSIQRANAARGTLKALADSPNGYFAQNLTAKRRVEQMETQDPAYVAHEFLNDTWQPLYVDQVMASLSEAKLTYAGSAAVAENSMMLAVPANHAALIQSAPDAPLRELLKDYAVNRQFRRDIYVRGAPRLTGKEAQAQLDRIAFALIGDTQTPEGGWPVPTGSARLKQEGVDALFARLREGPATHLDLQNAGTAAGVSPGDVAGMIMVLVHNNVVAPCRADHVDADRSAAQRLNDVVFDITTEADTHRYLATATLGSAIAVSYPDRLLGSIVLRQPALDDAGVLAQLRASLESSGRHLMRDGKQLDYDDATIAELTRSVARVREQVALWRSLGALA